MSDFCTNVRADVLQKYTTSDSPGPKYQPDGGAVLARAPSFSLGTSTRGEAFAAKGTPGPGEYEGASATTFGRPAISTLKSAGEFAGCEWSGPHGSLVLSPTPI